MRWLVIFGALLGVLMGINAQESDDFMLISAEPAGAYGTTDHMTLSPDGRLLAWTDSREGLCLHVFAIEEATCTSFPTRDLESHTALRWSPDSTTIALTENWTVNFSDSDLWLFDVDTATFTNRTDDGVIGNSLRADESTYAIDALPTWNPANGDLYFFRYQRNGSPYTLSLYRIPNSQEAFAGVVGGGGDVFTNTPEHIITLDETRFTGLSVYNGGTFAFDGGATISPDGTQLAFLVRPISRENLIGTINLNDGIFTELLPASAIDILGLPEWYTRENRMVLDGITWTASGENLLISTRIASTFGGVIEAMFYQLELSSNDVIPLFDFSNIPDERTYLTDDAHENPRTALVLPQSDTVLYFNFNRSAGQSNLSAYTLSDARLSVLASIPVDDFVYTEMTQASVGQNEGTLRVLMYGYLFTFARED